MRLLSFLSISWHAMSSAVCQLQWCKVRKQPRDLIKHWPLNLSCRCWCVMPTVTWLNHQLSCHLIYSWCKQYPSIHTSKPRAAARSVTGNPDAPILLYWVRIKSSSIVGWDRCGAGVMIALWELNICGMWAEIHTWAETPREALFRFCLLMQTALR